MDVIVERCRSKSNGCRQARFRRRPHIYFRGPRSKTERKPLISFLGFNVAGTQKESVVCDRCNVSLNIEGSEVLDQSERSPKQSKQIYASAAIRSGIASREQKIASFRSMAIFTQENKEVYLSEGRQISKSKLFLRSNFGRRLFIILPNFVCVKGNSCFLIF